MREAGNLDMGICHLYYISTFVCHKQMLLFKSKPIQVLIPGADMIFSQIKSL